MASDPPFAIPLAVVIPPRDVVPIAPPGYFFLEIPYVPPGFFHVLDIPTTPYTKGMRVFLPVPPPIPSATLFTGGLDLLARAAVERSQ